MARQRAEDEAIVIEELDRARSARERRAHEPQRLDMTSLLVTDQTEQMLCIALTRLARKNAVENALGVGELSALPQGQRLLGAQRSLARGRSHSRRAHDRRAPRRATPISSARSRSSGPAQSPTASCRKIRMVGYQGLSCDRAASASREKTE